MFNLLLAVGVTLLVSMIVLPKFRRDAFKKIGLDFEPDSDGSKVAAAVLSVVTLYASSWLLGWTLTIIFGFCLFLYLSRSDRDSLFNGLLTILRKIREARQNSRDSSADDSYTRLPPPEQRPSLPPPGAPGNEFGGWLEREAELNRPRNPPRRPPARPHVVIDVPVVHIPEERTEPAEQPPALTSVQAPSVVPVTSAVDQLISSGGNGTSAPSAVEQLLNGAAPAVPTSPPAVIPADSAPVTSMPPPANPTASNFERLFGEGGSDDK